MKEEKLQVFLEGVQKYFEQMMDPEELTVGTPYLVENSVPSAKDFTGVIAISGKSKGIVYFTAPKELLERLLVLMGEKDISEAFMIDLVGEVANTIAGNARSEFGEEFEISVPIVLRGAPDEIMLPRKDRSFVIPIAWKSRSAAIVVSLRKP
ncbi:chemotaxis protein CheX [Simonsiella muelleri]|uniref:Chemotaxis phosphatase CheX-like domain-containing protein n=1 Tax=Simonsiella muelleri ATCC 29453 TaxID=641147 RepID=V9HMP0_9NEIS|nr:chemotaxis protein CheX [Simonsiella muelleri]AUX62051.1 chemotaxis protein CheX [Simonsiella muelleri ATCC 29453]EFG31435.1 hypothetical protein HMPREF9021_00705 [Simonsiella muelleri ATCC 29453]UBQ54146.1 chemotaxis protein CheX [Simonsiella muelleri]